MNYSHRLEIYGFEFEFGRVPLYGRLGIFINFEDENIIKALINIDLNFFEALRQLPSIVNNYEARYRINNFDYLYLGGCNGDWNHLRSLPFSELSKLKEWADYVLSLDDCSEKENDTAVKILQSLNGNYPQRTYREKTPEEKAKAKFERNKPKLRLKLTIKNGYQCDNCHQNKEDSLCVIQKRKDDFDYDLENLTLRCRSCLNKIKSKNKLETSL